MDVPTQILTYFLSKQTKSPQKNLLNVYLKLELLIFAWFRLWHWKIGSVLTVQAKKRLRL